MNRSLHSAQQPLLGATRVNDRDWSFLVWAPNAERVAVRVYDDGDERDHDLTPSGGGYHSAIVGSDDVPTYRFVLDGEPHADPASRWQPDGVHGPSRAFDPSAFAWTDGAFVAPTLRDTVLYEMHVGTFTEAGTFDAAIERLDDLAALGITAVEVMPVAAFPGVRNWGYDGVFPNAVQESYGGPAAFQRFVDACHRRGLGVVLDVVYNHLGPEGAVHERFAPYFTEVYRTPWGAAVNVAEKGSDEVRRYFIENAEMWVRDFHVDGLRFDAIHGIVDPTASPFLQELTDALVRLGAALGRELLLIAESGDNNPRVITPAGDGGLGFGAQWNDDFHHSLHAALTGERDGYYEDFGQLEQLVRAINDGFVFQGEYSRFRGRRHGVSSRGMPSDRFVNFVQNHDQIGNRAAGDRLTTLVDPAQARLAAAVLLLTPGVPLLFMGEEYAETAPFPYFVDHSDPELLEAVRRGRAEEFGRDVDTLDPAAAATFEQGLLDWRRREAPEGKAALGLYQALLAARRAHPVITDPTPREHAAHLTGELLIVHRRSREQSMLAAFNFAAGPASLPLAEGLQWQQVLDGESLDAGAPLDQGALTLPAYGFALCVAAHEGTETLR